MKQKYYIYERHAKVGYCSGLLCSSAFSLLNGLHHRALLNQRNSLHYLVHPFKENFTIVTKIF